jgi:DegV family protein with EDD domain
MSKIHIVTDSTADLTTEQITQYSIHVVPLTIQIDGNTYTDKIDIQAESFLDMMETSKELPKSSQPAVGVFHELFEELGKKGDRIVSIHMTGGMSGTVKSAQAAAEMSNSDVTVIDSQFISYALSFQVLEAAQLAQQGATVEEIVDHLDRIRKNTNLFVVVDTLENLVKGGRIGKGRALIGSLLSIKPIASLEGGEYTPIHKARSHKQVVQYLFNRYVEDTKGKIIKYVGISQANGFAMSDPLKKMVVESGFNDVQVGFTSPVISTHTGIGAIGFMYTVDG